MKKNKLLLVISILLISIISTTYAVWQAGGGVKWIGGSETVDRFGVATTVDGVLAYTDSFTGLKWQATDTSGGGIQWGTGITNLEPIWNGTSYDYGVLTETAYPAFKHCTDLGGTWRLPTKKEMYSIMTKVETNSSSKYTKLESITTFNYWSSTSDAVNTIYACFGYFGSGHVGYVNKPITLQVLCIHD